MKTGKSEIISNIKLKSDYFKVVFYAPHIVDDVKPGQFVHVQINSLRDKLLRRPFSICDVEKNGCLTVVYKVVGEGTRVLSSLKAGIVCDLMGPLGNPYSNPKDDEYPVIAAGGYGAAATYILAKEAKHKGVLLIGARTKEDLILIEDYRIIGFDVKIATEDGSCGVKGFVTLLLEDYLKDNNGMKYRYYGCGPNPMMKAMAGLVEKYNNKAELSLDHAMCCGVGACYACVVKIKAPETPDGWKYVRTCREGPVFSSDLFYLD